MMATSGTLAKSMESGVDPNAYPTASIQGVEKTNPISRLMVVLFTSRAGISTGSTQEVLITKPKGGTKTGVDLKG